MSQRKEITHVTIHIITAEQKRVMAMNNDERIAYMGDVLKKADDPQTWVNVKQEINPFPKWVRDFLAKMNGGEKPRFDPLNRLYYLAVPGDMSEAYDWMETFEDALQKECDADHEKAAWCADNCLKASVTEADEAASMADLEGFLRGSAPDYHKKDKEKTEKEDQDEGADVEVDPEERG